MPVCIKEFYSTPVLLFDLLLHVHSIITVKWNNELELNNNTCLGSNLIDFIMKIKTTSHVATCTMYAIYIM